MNIERYVAEVELPDGFASIDCEIHKTEDSRQKEINLYLNFFSYKISNDIKNNDDLSLRQRLDLDFEANLSTQRDDIVEFLKEVLSNSYPEAVDITLKEIEID